MTAGSEHLRALDQVRDFFEEVASLLLTADSLMAKAQWKSLTGTQALTGLSYSLGSPRHWLPHSLYRCYGNSSAPRLLPMISVVLGVQKQETGLLEQPLITAALYRYETDVSEVNDKYADFAAWHLWMPDRRDDGAVCSFDPRTSDDWAKDCRAIDIESFAVSLLDIQDGTSLENRIVTPLLSLIDARLQVERHVRM